MTPQLSFLTIKRQRKGESPGPRVPAPVGMSWTAKDPDYITRSKVVKYRMSKATALSRYGRSLAAATPRQKENRSIDGFKGRISGGTLRAAGTGSYRTTRRKKRKASRMRRRGMYTGDGSFWSDAWKAMRTPLYDAAATGVKAVAPWSSGIVDATRGAMRAAGYGSYDLSSNALVDAGASTDFQAPVFGPVSDTGAIKIVHREYIGNVYAPEAGDLGFKLQSFDINPGLAKTFPWLAQLAANYDSYHINQLMFSFKSTVSEFQTSTGVVGQVMMATQYNQREPKFTSKMQMMQYHGVVSAKTNANAVLGVECAPGKTAGDDVKFVRYENLARSEDLKDYDKGRVSIATADIPDTLQGQAIGELWVSYNVVLMHPKVLTGAGEAIQQDAFIAELPENADGSTELECYKLAANYQAGLFPHLWPHKDEQVFTGTFNSIGCKVERYQAAWATIQNAGYSSIEKVSVAPLGATDPFGGIKITIPANYAGRLKIVLQVNTNLAEQSAEVEAESKFGEFVVAKQGEIDIQRDMLCGYEPLTHHGGSYPDSHVHNSQALCGARISDMTQQIVSRAIGSNNAVTQKGFQLEAHVNVRQAVGGQDNILLLLGQPIKNHVYYGGFLRSAMLVIQEYNSVLNLDQDEAFINSTGTQLDLD